MRDRCWRQPRPHSHPVQAHRSEDSHNIKLSAGFHLCVLTPNARRGCYHCSAGSPAFTNSKGSRFRMRFHPSVTAFTLLTSNYGNRSLVGSCSGTRGSRLREGLHSEGTRDFVTGPIQAQRKVFSNSLHDP